jgi:hypothetical protein
MRTFLKSLLLFGSIFAAAYVARGSHLDRA